VKIISEFFNFPRRKTKRNTIIMMIDETYYEYLISRYKNLRNKGRIENADIVYEEGNPSCGDMIKIYVKLSEDKNVIEDVKFEGKGCTISQVSADILADMVKGKTIEEAKKLEKKEFISELGIELSPIRIKCALLAYKVFKMGAYGIKIDDEKI
jgi:nitrogen fixation NifU-like protein